ncbi:MAG: SGNH/GDSL hydrolase family protein [Candidatus Hodarchaeales archaeon]
MKKIRILCIGNSHTAGFPGFDPIFGGNPKSSYEFWLEKLLVQNHRKNDFFLDNKGICGQTSSEILSRYDKIMSQDHYDLSIFWAGANDLALGHSTKKIQKNIQKSIVTAIKLQTPIVIVNIPPMGWSQLYDDISELNNYIQGLNDKYCITADVYSKLVHSNELLSAYDSGDGVHLSSEGYKKVAEVLFNCISPILNKVNK